MNAKLYVFLFCSLLFLPAPVFSETIRLVTGEVLIGEVTQASLDEIELAMTFPSERQIRLEISQVDPDSYYEALAARLDANDAESRLTIAEFCLDHGLFAQAVVEARTALELDPSLQGKVADLYKKAMEAIATRLLDQGKTYLAVDDVGQARVYFHSIVDRYSETKSAKKAKSLLRRFPMPRPKRGVGPIRDSRQKDAIRQKLTEAKELLAKADRRVGDLDRPFNRGGYDERLLRRSEPYYRKSFLILHKATSRPTDDETLNFELRNLTQQSRSRLAKLYVALGRVYLSRGAIGLAEDFSAKAYAVDPGSEPQYELHDRILDAQIAQRYGSSVAGARGF